MNELGFEALVMLSLIHGTKAETLVYTAGCAPRQPRGPCLSQLPEVATIPTTSYLPLVMSSFIKGPPESPWQGPRMYGLVLVAHI